MAHSANSQADYTLIPCLQCIGKHLSEDFRRVSGLIDVVAVITYLKEHVMRGQVLIIAVAAFQYLS